MSTTKKVQKSEELLKPIFLLLGENNVDKESFIEKIIETHRTNYGENNIEIFSLHATVNEDVDRLFEEIDSSGLFSKVKIFKIYEAEELTKKELQEIVKKASSNNVVILIAGVNPSKFDKTITTSIESKGTVKIFWKPFENIAKRRILEEFGKSGVVVDKEVIDFIIARNGNDINAIVRDIEELKNAVKKGELLTIDIAKSILLGIPIEKNVFDLIESIFKKDKVSAINILKELYNKGENLITILHLLSRELELVWKTKIMINKGMNEEEILKELGITKFEYEKVKVYANELDTSDLLTILRHITTFDRELKRVGPEMAIKNFEVRLVVDL